MLCTFHFLLFTPLLTLVIINIHVWSSNTCISRNNTLIEAHNLFKNKTPTDRQQYSRLLESSSTQLYQHKFKSILSGPAKAHDVKNHVYSTQVPHNISQCRYKFSTEKWSSGATQFNSWSSTMFIICKCLSAKTGY